MFPTPLSLFQRTRILTIASSSFKGNKWWQWCCFPLQLPQISLSSNLAKPSREEKVGSRTPSWALSHHPKPKELCKIWCEERLVLAQSSTYFVESTKDFFSFPILILILANKPAAKIPGTFSFVFFTTNTTLLFFSFQGEIATDLGKIRDGTRRRRSWVEPRGVWEARLVWWTGIDAYNGMKK